MNGYLLLKSLHILAVVPFLGNIITGVFWKAHADRSGDPRIMAHTMEGIIRSDRYFTVPGVFLIIIFGVWNAINAGLPIWGTPWIRWGIILFGISGFSFAFIAPLQKQIWETAKREPFDRGRYDALSNRWAFWGVLGLVTPLAALFLMVLKPGS